MLRPDTQALPVAQRSLVDDAAPESEHGRLDSIPLWQLCAAVAVAILALAFASILLR